MIAQRNRSNAATATAEKCQLSLTMNDYRALLLLKSFGDCTVHVISICCSSHCFSSLPSTNQLSHIQHCTLLSTILVYFSLPYAYILAISKSCYLQSVTFIGTNAEISLHNINLIDRTLLRCVECLSVRQYIRTQRKTPHDILVKRLVSDIFGLLV